MVNPTRHMTVFEPHAFNKMGIPVHIVGCGATGSRIATEISRLGVEKITAWDFDVLEEHNIPNQDYECGQVGTKKVEALKQRIKNIAGIEIEAKDEKVVGQALSGVVFLLVDKMSSRKEIFAKALRMKPHVALVVETRMGADNLRVYAFSPNKPSHIKAWEETLCTDEEAEVSACGAQTSVGATAASVSSLAVWQFIKWAAAQSKKDASEVENEILFAIRPFMLLTRMFPTK